MGTSICKTHFHFSNQLEAPFSTFERNLSKQSEWFHSNSSNVTQSFKNVSIVLQNHGLLPKLASDCETKLLTKEKSAFFCQSRSFRSSSTTLSKPVQCKPPDKKNQRTCLGEKTPPKISSKKEDKTVWCKSSKRPCVPPCKPTCDRIMMPSCEEPYRDICSEEEVEPPCEKLLPPTPCYSECLCTAPPRYLGCPECFPKFPCCPQSPKSDITCFPARKKIKILCKRRPMPEQKPWEDSPKCRPPPKCVLSERADNIYPGKVWKPLRNYFPENSRSYCKQYNIPISEKTKCIEKRIVPQQCDDACYTEDECIAAMRQQTEGKLEIKKSTVQKGSCTKWKSKTVKKPSSRRKRDFSSFTPFGFISSRSFATCNSHLEPVVPLPHKPFSEKTIKDIRIQTEGDCGRSLGKCMRVITPLPHCTVRYRDLCEEEQIYIPCKKKEPPYPSYAECKGPDPDTKISECLICPHSTTKRIIYRQEIRNCYSTQAADLKANETPVAPRKHKFLSITPSILVKPPMVQIRNYSEDELQPKYKFILSKPPFNAASVPKVDPSVSEKCLARRCKLLQTPYLGDEDCPENPECDTPENRAKYCKETVKHTLTCNDKITFKYPPVCTDKNKKKYSTLAALISDKYPNQFMSSRYYSFNQDRNPKMVFQMPSSPKAANITSDSPATGLSGMFRTVVNFFKARPCPNSLTDCHERHDSFHSCGKTQMESIDTCINAKPPISNAFIPPLCRLQSTCAGDNDQKKDKEKKCMKICCPGCTDPENRPRCIEEGVEPPCVPKPNPYPSFYESGRFQMARKPINECTIVEDLFWAKMIEESYMKLPKKKEAAKDKVCPPDPCSSQKRTFTSGVKNITLDLLNFTKPLSYVVHRKKVMYAPQISKSDSLNTNMLEQNLTLISNISTTSARYDEKHPFEFGEECKEKQKFQKPDLNMAKSPAEPCKPYEKPQEPPAKIVKCPPPKPKEKPKVRCKMPHGPPEILIDPHKRYKECCELPPPPTIKPCEDELQNTRKYSTVAVEISPKKDKNILKKSSEKMKSKPFVISRTVKWGELNKKGQQIFKDN